jgi:hypothetical protein
VVTGRLGCGSYYFYMLESCGEALEWTGTHIISVASEALLDGGSWRSVSIA